MRRTTRFLCKKNIATLLFGLAALSFLTNSANAVLINFDELDPASYIPADLDEWMIPLSNEYEDLGVLFSNSAYLDGYISGQPPSFKNVVGGPGFAIYFINELPKYVRLEVGSWLEAAVGVSAHGPDFYQIKATKGWVGGMSAGELDTPYTANQFLHFYSPTGISSIKVGGYQGMYIDNLEFIYEVPEPSAFFLLVLGLLASGLNYTKRYLFHIRQKF